MPANKIRVRFAPSPTGKLHVGNARTALFNWLHARKTGGTFILRIEDTDISRSLRHYETTLIDTLRWLGIDWDEGPDIGGPFGPYRQSERIESYRAYLKKLTDAGLVYPCYCTDEELNAERQQMLARGIAPRYSGKCRSLTEAQRQRLESEGRKPAIRFKVERGMVRLNDLIHGPVNFNTNLIGDFIIVRSTGLPAYNFAVVVDDALMKVSLVIRGEDHLSNTPRQILLYEALGFKPPQFAHHGLLLGADRSKLSKRHGVTTVEQLKEQGFVPEAITNYIAWIGGSLSGSQEILSTSEMIGAFDVRKAGKNAAVFDLAKLKWMNAKYLKRLPPETVLDHWLALGTERGLLDKKRLLQIVPLVKDNIENLGQLEELFDIFTEKNVAFSMEAEEVLRADSSAKVLKVMASALQTLDAPRSKDAYNALIKEVKRMSGYSGKKLFLPIRAALTGEMAGPELEKIFCNLDKDTLLHRIERALELKDRSSDI
ncbi:MAG: glutamate--tRNA ligase [Deltaproteobacteria bacterium]|nr:MAG: glutamate--tRNA ligase [Deltaproteobacteria bacterium]